MKKMKQVSRLFIALLVFVGCLSAAAHDASVVLELAETQYVSGKQQVYVGDVFQVRVIVSGSNKSSSDVSISGLDSFAIQGTSYQTNVSVNNGVMQAEKIVTYSVLAKKHGTFQIGPASVSFDGSIITSNEVTLIVESQENRPSAPSASQKINADAQDSSSSTSDTSDAEVFCKMSTDKTTVMVEEPIVLDISIYWFGDGIRVDAIQPPDFRGCGVKEIKQPKQFKQVINGKSFNVISKKLVLFPIHPGVKNLKPAQIMFRAPRKPSKFRKFGPFIDEEFAFLMGNLEEKSVESNTLKIEVKPLPSFDRAIDGIGEFTQFTACVDKTSVVANEPIKLSMEITGKGNLDQVLAPKLKLSDGAKSYDSKTEINQNWEQEFSAGVKRFEFIVQIPRVGVAVIPSQQFVYFNVRTKQIESLQSGPITLDVAAPSGQSQLPLPGIGETQLAQGQNVAQAVVNDIHFIGEDLIHVLPPVSSLPIWVFVLLVILVPSIMFGLTRVRGFVRPFIDRISTSPSQILNKYKKLLLHTAQDHPEKIFAIFIDFFATHFHRSTTEIRIDYIEKTLLEYGMAEEKVVAFVQYLSECAQFSFGAQAKHSVDTEKLLKKGEYWLMFIHQILQNQRK